jgi:hypothetical protein
MDFTSSSVRPEKRRRLVQEIPGSILGPSTVSTQFDGGVYGGIHDPVTLYPQYQSGAYGGIHDPIASFTQYQNSAYGNVLNPTTSFTQYQSGVYGGILDPTTSFAQYQSGAYGGILGPSTSFAQYQSTTYDGGTFARQQTGRIGQAGLQDDNNDDSSIENLQTPNNVVESAETVCFGAVRLPSSLYKDEKTIILMLRCPRLTPLTQQFCGI